MKIKKVEVTKEEAALLMASRFAIDGSHVRTEMFVTQMNQFIAQHQAKLEEIADAIRERVKDCPATPVSEWEFDGIDPISFKGTVGVPEDDVEPEDDTDFGGKDIEPEDK